MKRLIIFGTLILTFNITTANAQCSPQKFTDECVPKLADGFNFLKGYKIDGKSGEKAKVEYSYVFTKGTQYMINVCAEETGIVINLFDARRNKIASSVVNGQYASAIAFPCRTTGIYYISYTFEGEEYCGGSALGFRKI